MQVNKNQLAGNRGDARKAFFSPDNDCLRKHNYSTGAGFRTVGKRALRFEYINKRLRRKGIK